MSAPHNRCVLPEVVVGVMPSCLLLLLLSTPGAVWSTTAYWPYLT